MLKFLRKLTPSYHRKRKEAIRKEIDLFDRRIYQSGSQDIFDEMRRKACDRLSRVIYDYGYYLKSKEEESDFETGLKFKTFKDSVEKFKKFDVSDWQGISVETAIVIMQRFVPYCILTNECKPVLIAYLGFKNLEV